jgi:hypothetical protein
MRTSLLAVGAAALIGGATVLAFFSGGYFDRPRVLAAITAWVLVAIVAVIAPKPVPDSTPSRAALTGLFLLCAWTALSLTWTASGGRAQDDLQRLLMYLGVFVASLALLRGVAVRRWLEPSLAFGALVIVGYGLSERLLPGLIELDRSRSAAGRLEQPLSYWNAFGIVAAIGLVLAVRIAGDPDRGRGGRAAAAAAGVLLGLGVYLSFSRGALAAALAGLIVLVALAPAGRPQARSLVVITAAAVVAALIATRYSTVESLAIGEQGDWGDGVQMLVAVVVLALIAAAVVLRRPRRELHVPSLSISRPAAVLTLTLLTLLAGATASALLEGKPEGTSPAPGADPARLRSIDTNRYRYWDVAIDTWVDEPVTGAGSGSFRAEWLKERDRVDASGDAHSLYLETAAELGLVGLAFLLLFLGGVAAGSARLYRLDRAAATGPIAGMAAWAVHAGLDWDWEMPAATLPALLLAAAAIAWSEERAADAEDGYHSAETGAIGTPPPHRAPTPERAI